jgi:tRNA (guanine26-N2/guanine27-N2)-dimethyltransferase
LGSKKRKRRPQKKGAQDGHGAADAVTGVTAVDGVEEVQNMPEPAGASAPNKRKRDGEDKVQNGTGEKRLKATAALDTAEFEDGGIDDEDLLAVESSMQDNVPFSTAIEAPANSEQAPKPQDEPSITTTKGPPEGQDTRPPFRILDALSATGLRALRYAQELPFNTQVTANDLSPAAVAAIKLNIKHNRLEKRIKTSVGNANAHMYSFVAQEGTGGPGHKYHVVDIDPYGTATPFLDAAVQATADNGLLCVTCTDTGVFNSMGYAEKAFSLYGGLPGKGDHCHEIGLRLILHAITTTAAKYGIHVEPLLSLSIDYYARVFVRIKKSPADVKFLASKTMLVYQCDHGCGAWKPQFLMRAVEQSGKKNTTFHKHVVAQGPTSDRLCESCGSKMHVAGPMWGGAMHNPSFVQKVLDLVPEVDEEVYKTLPRLEGMLSVAMEECLVQEVGKMVVPVDEKGVLETNGVKEKVEIKTNGRVAKEGEEAVEAVGEQNDKPNSDTSAETTGQKRKRANSSSPAPEEPPVTKPVESSETPATTEQGNTDGTHTTAPATETLPNRTYQPLNSSFRDIHPFYIIPSSLSRVLHVQAPSDSAFRGALRGLGYQAVRSHCHAGTIKTSAPWTAIWDVMVAWTSHKPIREGALSTTSAGHGVLKRAKERAEDKERECRDKAEATKNERVEKLADEGKSEEEIREILGRELEAEEEGRKIVFDEVLGREAPRAKRLVRYQINPRANWGPMARAK